VNAHPAEREASGSPHEGGKDNYLNYLNPKNEARNSKQIRMTKKIAMTKTQPGQAGIANLGIEELKN
jgi:hypothetical protein